MATVLNKRRLATIARWLENGAPEKDGVTDFSMEFFSRKNQCGTTCCVAGAAVAFFGTKAEKAEVKKGAGGDLNYITEGRRLLGLTPRRGMDLFYGCEFALDGEAEKRVAAVTIRRLIKTGRVRWESPKE